MDNIERQEPRHFALPAAFILALLGFFFFGMNNPTRPPITAIPQRTPPPKGDADKPKHDDPPPLVALDDSDPVDAPIIGGGGQPQPTQIDEPQPFRPGAFVVPVETPTPQPTRPVTEIGPIGRGPGGGNGPGFGGGRVTSWVDLDQPPRARAQASPVYPVQDKSLGVTGKVEVEFTVDETGAVVNPWVVSSTHRSFEEPTLRAVEKWRFVPGRHHGEVVKFRMCVPVLFNLND